MACFVTGQNITEVAAMIASHGANRRLEDDAHLHLKFADGAIASLWSNAVAVGQPHGLRLRVFCGRRRLGCRRRPLGPGGADMTSCPDRKLPGIIELIDEISLRPTPQEL
jgi:hypothetical protein